MTRRRWVALAIVAAVVAGIAVIGMRFADDGLVYYRTPSEVASAAPSEQVMRLSGLVMAGSVTRGEPASSLILTDGAADIEVRYPGRLPATVHEGEGAVVEGRLVGNGVFLADEILLRHSNEYGPDDREYDTEGDP